MQGLRQAVLRHVRLPVQSAAGWGGSSSGQAAVSLAAVRFFAGGGYLDKDEVIQRVLDVTKHFEKIDASRVSMGQPGV
jgi:NADH dehydrogenase (ubiquinone) 1 alpha/beta subcomplex 1